MFNYALFSGGIDDGAYALDKFFRKNKIEKAILLGVSIGGLTACRYTQLFGFAKVEKIIALGSPFRGTPWALPLCIFKGGRELLPGSKFINNFNAQKITNPERIVCINAKYDELVPDASSRIKGVRQIELDIVGHNYLHIFAKEAYETILQEATSKLSKS